jgi:hypothetical protein
LERQIRTGAALRDDRLGKKVSPVVTQIHPDAIDEFKKELLSYDKNISLDYFASIRVMNVTA